MDAPVGTRNSLGANSVDNIHRGKQHSLPAQAFNQRGGQYNALVGLPCQIVQTVNAGAVVPNRERLEAKDGLQF